MQADTDRRLEFDFRRRLEPLIREAIRHSTREGNFEKLRGWCKDACDEALGIAFTQLDRHPDKKDWLIRQRHEYIASLVPILRSVLLGYRGIARKEVLSEWLANLCDEIEANPDGYMQQYYSPDKLERIEFKTGQVSLYDALGGGYRYNSSKNTWFAIGDGPVTRHVVETGIGATPGYADAVADLAKASNEILVQCRRQAEQELSSSKPYLVAEKERLQLELSDLEARYSQLRDVIRRLERVSSPSTVLPPELASIENLIQLGPAIISSGIYFLIRDGRLRYVGKSLNLGQRVASHLREKVFDSVWILPAPPADLEKLERRYIRDLAPPENVAIP